MCRIEQSNDMIHEDYMLRESLNEESILMSVCKYGDVKGLRFIKSLMNEKTYIEHITSSRYSYGNSTALRAAIKYNNSLIVKEILSDDKILNNIDNEQVDQLMKLAFIWDWASLSTIDILIDSFKLTPEQMKEYFNGETVKDFLEVLIISDCNNWKIWQRVHDVVGKDKFCKRILKKMNNPLIPQNRMNYVEYAVAKNLFECLRYFMSLESIKHECTQNKDKTWRLVSIMNRKDVTKKVIKYMVQELSLTEKIVLELISYTPKISDDIHDPDEELWKYWEEKIPKEVIGKLFE